MFVTQLRAVDFTVGYEIRPRGRTGGATSTHSKPAVVASTQLVSFDVDAQRLRRLTPAEKDYLSRFVRTDDAAGAIRGASAR